MKLTFQYHVCRYCNYSCIYCYFRDFEASNHLPIVHENEKRYKNMLFELSRRYTIADVLQVPIDDDPRINIVGGEPTSISIENLSQIVDNAKEFGFKTSIVTNGSSEDKLLDIAPRLDVVGISVNTFDRDIAIAGGFCNRRNNDCMSEAKFAWLVKEIRAIAPNTEIKVNVVVSWFNYDSKIVAKLQEHNLDRIKIFRQLKTGCDDGILDEHFQRFLDINGDACFKDNVRIVGNNEMCGFYIDPYGRFFKSRNDGVGYEYSDPIYEVGIDVALRQINFDLAKYTRQYMRAA